MTNHKYRDNGLLRPKCKRKRRAPLALKNSNLQDDEVSHIVTSTIGMIDVFYEKFVVGKYKLSKEQFAEVISIEDKNIFYNVVKSKFKINRKDSEKLFASIRKDFNSLFHQP